MHDRFNNWLVTVALVVGISVFVAIGVQSVAVSYAAITLSKKSEEPADGGGSCYSGPFPDEQRSWADLFAACRLTDAWLGSDIEGEPVCYSMGQTETSLEEP